MSETDAKALLSIFVGQLIAFGILVLLIRWLYSDKRKF